MDAMCDNGGSILFFFELEIYICFPILFIFVIINSAFSCCFTILCMHILCVFFYLKQNSTVSISISILLPG